jgi:hypothetical protein
MDSQEAQRAENACTALTVRFFHHLDRREYDRVAGLFAPDGVWLRQGVPIAGTATLLDTLNARPADLTTRHLLSNIVVDRPDPRTSIVHYDLSVHSADASGPARLRSLMTGQDRLERDGDGWRIRLKRAEPVFVFGG